MSFALWVALSVCVCVNITYRIQFHHLNPDNQARHHIANSAECMYNCYCWCWLYWCLPGSLKYCLLSIDYFYLLTKALILNWTPFGYSFRMMLCLSWNWIQGSKAGFPFPVCLVQSLILVLVDLNNLSNFRRQTYLIRIDCINDYSV